VVVLGVACGDEQDGQPDDDVGDCGRHDGRTL
jgi:hypothetical protein